MKPVTRSFAWSVILAAAMALGGAVVRSRAADASGASAEKQRQLIAVLESSAPPQEKAITCKRLAIYGTKDAVPALAPLLADEQLSSWARIALEAIPDPAADDALRAALEQTRGRLLIGVINSIGYRRDPKAVAPLTQKLKDADLEVASAAAAALGAVGGDSAAKALLDSLAGGPAGVRPAAAEGCVLCAERFLAGGKPADAVKLYDAVRKADVPKQRILEATRGAILARQSAGLPLLLEQLRSADKSLFGIGLRTARELPGRQVTEALAAEVAAVAPERQAALLLAVADRSDAAVAPAVLRQASAGAKPARIAAFKLLDRFENLDAAPVLLDAAAGEDQELAEAAKPVLAKLPGQQVDAYLAGLLARDRQASARKRQVLIEMAGRRRIGAALPGIVPCAEDSDAAIRSAAIGALGALGQAPQTADLVRLLQKTQDSKERGDLEKALLALAGRCGAACAPHLLPLAQNSDSALRRLALHALSSVGGPAALAAVKAALTDADETVQDEAVRTLSTWAGNWPEDAGVAEPLLTLAKSGKKASHQVLGVRGYVQYIQGDKRLREEEKVAHVRELLPLITRPEEKRLALSALTAIPTAGALELVMTCAEDAALAREAHLAIVTLAAKNDLKDASKELRSRALQMVVDKSNDERTKRKAEDALKKLK